VLPPGAAWPRLVARVVDDRGGGAALGFEGKLGAQPGLDLTAAAAIAGHHAGPLLLFAGRNHDQAIKAGAKARLDQQGRLKKCKAKALLSEPPAV
jgi:hypothetical protein